MPDELGYMVVEEVVRELRRLAMASGKGEGQWTWPQLRQAIAKVLVKVRRKWAPQNGPRILCLVSLEGGAITLRAKVDAERPPRAPGPPARVRSMVGRAERKPGLSPRGGSEGEGA